MFEKGIRISALPKHESLFGLTFMFSLQALLGESKENVTPALFPLQHAEVIKSGFEVPSRARICKARSCKDRLTRWLKSRISLGMLWLELYCNHPRVCTLNPCHLPGLGLEVYCSHYYFYAYHFNLFCYFYCQYLYLFSRQLRAEATFSEMLCGRLGRWALRHATVP